MSQNDVVAFLSCIISLMVQLNMKNEKPNIGTIEFAPILENYVIHPWNLCIIDV